MVGPVVTSTMLPSALAPFTALMPIRPSPPVRFSTTMVRCSAGAISCAISRHSVSPPAPAANGKIIFVSPACACDPPACANSGKPRHPAMKLRRSIGFLFEPIMVGDN
ncbi:DNA-binding transcriptional LysR family regulator [Bradyrhizobium japonicum]|nr:DNA-binding transcriptional LysR family regulator [Bradyrhizobium japonicum]MCS3987877.1 DNA-binding transcriptional LysR family regulator [Bradyrhizobium japonicum]MCS4017305.1 DNA-binding transcriptional LysR family regulator [Bradyrhizobium japonicum]MCS4204402.1 DNA-binding transcriptional LysR family regulator [Bradyrhizobium japonicum]